jgi:hypothetical protein
LAVAFLEPCKLVGGERAGLHHRLHRVDELVDRGFLLVLQCIQECHEPLAQLLMDQQLPLHLGELSPHGQPKLVDLAVQRGGDLAQREPDLAQREDPIEPLHVAGGVPAVPGR